MRVVVVKSEATRHKKIGAKKVFGAKKPKQIGRKKVAGKVKAALEAKPIPKDVREKLAAEAAEAVAASRRAVEEKQLDESYKKHVSPDEVQARRKALAWLMSENYGREECIALMQSKFVMQRPDVVRLFPIIAREWQDDEADQRPRYKQAALVRLRKIAAIASEGKELPVLVQVERLRSDIEGTRAPIQVKVDVTSEIRNALTLTIAQLESSVIARLIKEGREICARAGWQVPVLGESVEPQVFDVVSEDVEPA